MFGIWITNSAFILIYSSDKNQSYSDWISNNSNISLIIQKWNLIKCFIIISSNLVFLLAKKNYLYDLVDKQKEEN